MARRRKGSVLDRVLAVAEQVNASPKERKAAVETGIVESNLTNPSGGDADSAGWRQERRSLYPNPTNVEAAARRFFSEARSANRPGISAGELAARVQRPAAAYRGRYQAVSGQAESLLGGNGSGAQDASGLPPAARVQVGHKTAFDQAGYERAQRLSLVGGLIARRRGTDSVLFRSGLLSTAAPDPAQFTQTSLTSKIVRGQGAARAPGAPSLHPSGAAGAAVSAARARLGVSEVAGSNRGAKLDRWQAKFGMVGQPWCGIFVGIALKNAGVQVSSRIASVAAIEQDAKAHRNGFRGWVAPQHAQPGDALVIRSGGHVGLVESVDRDGTIHTIEGNTGNGAVQRRTHRPGDVVGAARPAYGGRR